MCRVKAVVQQIREFGQTPSQLFKAPHPSRKVRGWSQFQELQTIHEGSSVDGSGDGTDGHSAHTPEPIGARSRSVSHTFSEDVSVTDPDQEDHDESPMHARTATRSMDVATWGTVAKRNVLLTFKRLVVQDVHNLVRCMQWVDQRSGRSHWNVIASIVVVDNHAPRERERERVYTTAAGALLLPPRHTTYLSWGYLDTSLRVHSVTANESGSSGETRSSVRAACRDGCEATTDGWGSVGMCALRLRLICGRRPSLQLRVRRMAACC
jgi:hypothetical protein